MAGPPTSKRIDLLTSCIVLDPLLRAPPETYVFPPSRKFVERIPPASEDFLAVFYASSDGTSMYAPIGDGGATFYAYTGA